MIGARGQLWSRCTAWLVTCGLMMAMTGCSRSPEAEADAVQQLKALGVLTIKDNNTGFVKVVNLSTLDDPAKTADAVKFAAQLVQPASATFNNLTLSPEDLAAIGSMKTLNELNLTETNVDDAGVQKLSGLKKLGTLYLVGTKITDNSLNTISGFKELKVLGLGRTGLTGSFAPLNGLKKLNWIEISEMKLSDDLLKSLGQLPALQTVTMLDSEHNPKIIDELKATNNKLQFDIVRGSLGGGREEPEEGGAAEAGGKAEVGGTAEDEGKAASPAAAEASGK
ncbi:MAG: hypothetical protein U0795_03465 [Pirellulales bacterium]